MKNITNEERRLLKNMKNREWSKNNPEKVKQHNQYHHRLRQEKLIKTRKEELKYDDHVWYKIENFDYYINEDLVIINKNYKKIKIYTDRIGYQVLRMNGKSFMYHRIIASVFIPNPENKKEINHINGIKSDNRIENLEWSTRSENVKHSFDVLGKKSNLIGWREKKAKTLNNSKVDDI